MFALHIPDAQTLITLAIGLVAAVHVCRRWWPTWRGMLAMRPGHVAQPAQVCGVSPAPADGATSGCSSGCGQCGSSGSGAPKDHRVHIVRR